MVEFHVLRCTFCHIFQVLQVTKTSKWKCKLCGEKQSIIKVYGRGTGVDCRKHVQKLNTLRGKIDQEVQENYLLSVLSDPPKAKSSDHDSQTVEDLPSDRKTSHWSKFLDVPGDIDTESTDVDLSLTTDFKELHKNRKRKREEPVTQTMSRFTKTSNDDCCSKQNVSNDSFGKQFSQINKQFQCNVFKDGYKQSINAKPDPYNLSRDKTDNLISCLKKSTLSNSQHLWADHSVSQHHTPSCKDLCPAVESSPSGAYMIDCSGQQTEPGMKTPQLPTIQKNKENASLKWASFLDNESGSEDDDVDDCANIYNEKIPNPVYVTSLNRPDLHNYLSEEEEV
ncbi:hypothetical protein Btru_056351 [Bulinus truncatus]|nr:hypothetical protein Btru_056351 [Bulinus truncatus]